MKKEEIFGKAEIFCMMIKKYWYQMWWDQREAYKNAMICDADAIKYGERGGDGWIREVQI